MNLISGTEVDLVSVKYPPESVQASSVSDSESQVAFAEGPSAVVGRHSPVGQLGSS